VRYRDFEWLRKHFDTVSLQGVLLSMAETLYPRKQWEALENGLENAAITDAERTMVFDITNFDRFSAGASLIWAGDTVYQPSEKVLAEFNRICDERIKLHEERMRTVQQHLAMLDKPSTIVPIGSRDLGL
jgi:hypothetical protein